jgi:predicted transcriptional regulator
MKGEQLARIVEQLLAERGISKGAFYSAVGISATALYGWKRGAEPRPETVAAIEKYFGIDLKSFEKSDVDDETAELLQSIRERQDLRILLHSARDVPPSSVYQLVAQLEKEREETI